MHSKLTLSIDDKVISTAKEVAQHQGTSISALVEAYLKSLGIRHKKGLNQEQITLSPTVASLKGSVKPPKDFDGNYDKVINSYREKKWKSQ